MPFGTEIGLIPGDFVLDGDQAPPPPKGHSPPNFRSMSIVAKWSPISATAEHLFLLVSRFHDILEGIGLGKRISQLNFLGVM